MSPNTITSPQAVAEWRGRLQGKKDAKKITIAVCDGSGCRSCACGSVAKAFQQELQPLGQKVELKTTGCIGLCSWGPVVLINPAGIVYVRVSAQDVPTIIAETITSGKTIDRLAFTDPRTGKAVPLAKDIPFLNKQSRQLLGKNGRIDPTSIDDYVASGGYQALAKVCAAKPDGLIEDVKRSGLKSQTINYLVGDLWKLARQTKGDPKYLIANADDGNPGSYGDRALCEGNPHAIIEGLIIGAYAIGAKEGIINVRAEQAHTIEVLTRALADARACGFLGEKILGTALSFDIEIASAGAFMAGESTALTAALEGRIAEPRARYIHTLEEGLWDKPTVLHDVKTWALIPLILGHDAGWYAGARTHLVSLTGMVKNRGLAEVPARMTLQELIDGIGGGMSGDKKLKAVQIGGPANGTLVACNNGQHKAALGAPIVSGPVIVMDESVCMIDMARHFVRLLKQENCGKCVPCRDGLKMLDSILARICDGQGTPDDVATIEELSQVIMDTSLCQLGARAPEPVMTITHSFRDEYLAHINEKRCPAGVCSMGKENNGNR